MGIFSIANAGGSISGNRVRGIVGDGTGSATGITAGAGNLRITLRNNEVVGTGTGAGIRCDANGEVDRAMGNVINGFAFHLQCGDAGGNDITP